MPYSELNEKTDAYSEKILAKVGTLQSDKKRGFIYALAQAPKIKTFRKAMDVVGDSTFTLDDGIVRVDVTVVTSVYNTRLHGSVSYYMVETFIRNGSDVDKKTQFFFKTSWSSEKKEMLFEAIDSILDDIEDAAVKYYGYAWDSIEGKKVGK